MSRLAGVLARLAGVLARLAGVLSRFGRVAGIAVAAAGLGLLLLAVAGLRATVWAPAATSTSRVSAPAGVPLLVTDVALLSGGQGQVRVLAVHRDAAAPVFLGVGRAADVQAYLGGVARAELSGEPGRVRATVRAGEAALPDPNGVDVWAAQVGGAGRVQLQWPLVPGQWRLVAAGTGGQPAPDVEITQPGPGGGTGAPVLVALGLGLVVAGAVTALTHRRRLVAGDGVAHEGAEGRQDAGTAPLPFRSGRHRAGPS